MSDDPPAPSDSIVTPGSEPPPPAAEHLGWTAAMLNAVTRPVEVAYTQIANDPGASTPLAILWIFLSKIISLLLMVALFYVFTPDIFQILQQFGPSGLAPGQQTAAITRILIYATPFWAVLSTLAFIFTVALMQLTARIFGGQGSFRQLIYTISAFQAPLTLIATPFIAIPFLGALLNLLLMLYIPYLQVLAVKAANRLGWGKSTAVVVIATLVIFGLAFCLSIAFMVAVIRIISPGIGQPIHRIPTPTP